VGTGALARPVERSSTALQVDSETA